MRHARRTQGLTLLELTLIVAVIATVAAVIVIATTTWIHGATHARTAANESSAMDSLKAIHKANEQCFARSGKYADSLASLTAAASLDGQLGSGTKSGYAFDYWSDGRNWDVVAEPTTPGVSGKRSFFVDTSGVIRSSEGSVPTSKSPPADS